VWAGLRSRISGLVKVRDLAKARWADGITQARQHLARGDVEQAIATLRAIEGKPPEELSGWLADAQARAAIERGAAVLAQAVRNRVGAMP
jgi:hypothetical protein